MGSAGGAGSCCEYGKGLLKMLNITLKCAGGAGSCCEDGKGFFKMLDKELSLRTIEARFVGFGGGNRGAWRVTEGRERWLAPGMSSS